MTASTFLRLPLFLGLLVVSGCFSPNGREFLKGKTELRAMINQQTGSVSYYKLDIPTYHTRNAIPEALGLEVSPGNLIRLRDVTEELLRHDGAHVIDEESVPNDVTYHLAGASFSFINGKLVWVRIVYGQSKFPPVLWDLRQHRRYVLPLTEIQVIELFGPPDRFVNTVTL